MHLPWWQSFFKKFLFGAAYKTREYTILNHKIGTFCVFLKLYKNVDMKDCQ